MSYKVTILGCGNSTGVPAIGNYWGACDPNEPKNRRLRSSIIVEDINTRIVIDTGADFRYQLNRAKIEHIDAALYTHAHSDHAHGIDELRVIVRRSEHNKIPIYLNQETYDDLNHRFDYLFKGGKLDVYPPILDPTIFQNSDFGQRHTLHTLNFTPFTQDHGSCTTVGYRFNDLAYSVDLLTLEQGALETLKGVKTWIVDGAGYHQENNPAHANLNAIYKMNDYIGAQNVYITSLTLGMDYQTLLNELPTGYKPAYDGLILNTN